MTQALPRTAAAAAGSTGETVQAAAMCYRRTSGSIEVLLVTSRGTGRWILPKGWIAPGGTPAETAAREAFEEAGVHGRIHPQELGRYTYGKLLDSGVTLPCTVAVFALAVEMLAPDFPERDERRRRWVPAHEAARMVHEPDLRYLLDVFARQEVGG